MDDKLRQEDKTNVLLPTKVETEHVHKVYDNIAPHFSHTRHHPWPLVTEFLNSLEVGAIVADIGCGNGKYLSINPQLCMLGSDRSIPLLNACAAKHENRLNLFGCDAINVPMRTSSCDAAISIAVLHHISTVERRIVLLSELARVVKINGYIFIVAWAFEQDEQSKRKFDDQDVFVEWKLQAKYAASSNENAAVDHAKVDNKARWTVYQRYCHVYRRGELEDLVKQVPELQLLETEYSRSNWCLNLRRVEPK